MKVAMLPALATAPDALETIRVAARARRIALRLTQAELAARSGVPVATLKRFEQRGAISLNALLAIAVALAALEGFVTLFPAIEARTLDELDRKQRRPQRVRHKDGTPG
jgi:transcriptional regulator with XRE-family HTH domain